MTDMTVTRAASAAELAEMVRDLSAYERTLLTVTDLAALLGKSVSMIRKLRATGALPPPIRIRGFRGLRWTPGSIRSYLESLTPNRATGA